MRVSLSLCFRLGTRRARGPRPAHPNVRTGTLFPRSAHVKLSPYALEQVRSMPSRQAAPERQRDAVRTKREILEVATREFADRGYAGARVDEIAARTRTTKRMIYYYFGGKEQLYVAVLEAAYAGIRSAERDV